VREALILDVAGQVFARDGYHAASMDEIASGAEVSKPMVYAYFGSKEQLYLAYIDRTGGELLERLMAAASDDNAPMGALRARVTEFFKFVDEHRDGWRVLFAEAASSRPVADQVAELRGRIAALIRRMLEDPRASGLTLTQHAADGIAHAIVGAGESLANWWLEHPDVPRDQAAAWYIGVVQAAVVSAAAPAR